MIKQVHNAPADVFAESPTNSFLRSSSAFLSATLSAGVAVPRVTRLLGVVTTLAGDLERGGIDGCGGVTTAAEREAGKWNSVSGGGNFLTLSNALSTRYI